MTGRPALVSSRPRACARAPIEQALPEGVRPAQRWRVALAQRARLCIGRRQLHARLLRPCSVSPASRTCRARNRPVHDARRRRPLQARMHAHAGAQPQPAASGSPGRQGAGAAGPAMLPGRPGALARRRAAWQGPGRLAAVSACRLRARRGARRGARACSMCSSSAEAIWMATAPSSVATTNARGARRPLPGRCGSTALSSSSSCAPRCRGWCWKLAASRPAPPRRAGFHGRLP